MQEYFSTLLLKVIASIPNALTALLIFGFGLYLARILSDLLKKILLSRNTIHGITVLLAEILRWSIIVFGTITALQRFFDVTAFLTGLGIIGFVVGFALQNIVQNFVSGVILLIQQPFKIGDEISVLDLEGVVLKIDLRTTEMKTLDGRIAILPNADVLSHVIVNNTRAKQRRVDIPITVAYGSNPEQVQHILLGAVRSVPGFVASPQPEVNFTNFGHSSIEMVVWFWVDVTTSRIEFAKDTAMVNISKAFEEQNIQIPVPAQAVYVRSQS